jgi:ribosomal protein S18 acetylase RimI-like enzyme
MTKYVRAYAEPLGFDQSHVEAVVAREMAFAYPEVIRLAGVVEGDTVGTCTLSLGTEVAGLYCIATDAGHRRSGIATALTVEALRLARESGRTVATLQASSDGEPVYRRIGFETVSRYALFRLPE